MPNAHTNNPAAFTFNFVGHPFQRMKQQESISTNTNNSIITFPLSWSFAQFLQNRAKDNKSQEQVFPPFPALIFHFFIN